MYRYIRLKEKSSLDLPVELQEKVTKDFLSFLKKWETFFPKAEKDITGGKHCIIGFGRKARSCDEKTTIKKELPIMEKVSKKLYKTISKRYKNKRPQQYVALMSLDYNTPVTRPVLTKHTWINRHMEDWKKMKWFFLYGGYGCGKYTKSGVFIGNGLGKRRIQELKMLFSESEESFKEALHSSRDNWLGLKC